MYYVVDTTVYPKKVMQFATYPEILNYLEGMSLRKYNKSRKERMIVLEEMGHGEDDTKGVNFVRSMAEAFDIGVIRDNRLVRCDITSIAFFQKEEYGN